MKQILLGAGLAFLICIILAPISIRILAKLKAGQPILGYVDNHLSKQGTPTMGGAFMILAVVIAAFSLMRGEKSMAVVTVASFFGYGAVGFLDDFIKVRFCRNEGLAAYQKIIAQLGLAVILSVYCYQSGFIGGELIIPFTGKTVDIGWGIIPLSIVVLLSFTNSVNLTDGLDGLACMTTASYLIPFLGVLAYTLSAMISGGMGITVTQEWQNLLIMGGAILGAVLGFFLFNANPARVFMGDTGSLAIGGGLAVLALCTKTTLFVPIIGIMFVWSSISVIVQVCSFKLTRKRVFKMAPYHHHLERCGFSETRVGVLYGLITLFMGGLVILITLSFGGFYGAG